MTPIDAINRLIEQKRKEISDLSRTAERAGKIYSMIEDLVRLAESSKPSIQLHSSKGWLTFLNEFCTVSIATPRGFGKTTALLQWELQHQNCLVWCPASALGQIDSGTTILKGNSSVVDQFERKFRGTKKQVDYLLIDEYHAGKVDVLTELQGAIIAQNSVTSKKDANFMTIKVGTPR